MIKLIEFKNQNVKLIEYKPIINRLWNVIDNWNKDFKNHIAIIDDFDNWHRKECIDCNYQECLPCPLDD